MSNIRCIYGVEPTFPATDQHPDAIRYRVGSYWVDAVGGEPTIDAVEAVLRPPAPDLQPYQFFAMFELSGKKVPLMAYIDALPVPANVIARAKLEHTLVFHRENDLVLAAQSALGLTDQQLDALWNQAAALK